MCFPITLARLHQQWGLFIDLLGWDETLFLIRVRGATVHEGSVLGTLPASPPDRR
ncbi:hypothetical protein SynBIOSE41_01257 [Synechococcus sp. BIOS-E4-1]|nr:hypothetical protein SynBIOSE41_01257 [Synechococcus sp. BIOS-E4-1]